MTQAPENVGEFTVVDATEDSHWFIDFMDVANAIPEYGRIRVALADALGDLRGARLLEVGCGTGDDARELAAMVGPEGHVLATDVSETMVAEARRRQGPDTPPVEFAVADMSGLGFPDASFDAVRAKLVRQHCTDIDTADDELVRVLRPGGRLCVFDYDFETLVVDHPDRRATREAVRCWVDGHRHGWIGRQLERRFTDRGLVDVTIVPHTVRLPFEFFRSSMTGTLAAAAASGEIALSADDVEAWWRPLSADAAENRFFAALTGFVFAGTRPL